MGSDDRERYTSKAVSSLVFDPAMSSRDAIFDESWSTIIGFKRSSASCSQTLLSSTGFEPGCRVILSTDSTTTALAISNGTRKYRTHMHIVRGSLHSATDNHIRILASRDDLSRLEETMRQSSPETMQFRLDREESSTGTGTLRQNLHNLFTADRSPPGEPGMRQGQRNHGWLRDVLVKLKKPVFDDCSTHNMFEPCPGSNFTTCIPGCNLSALKSEYWNLNPDQKEAAKKVCGFRLVIAIASIFSDLFTKFLTCLTLLGCYCPRLQFDPRSTRHR
jgi:hypothetical protein